MKLLKTSLISTAVFAAISTSAIAVELDGLMTVEPKIVERSPLLDENGNPVLRPNGNPVMVPTFISGSFFTLGGPGPNPFSGTSQEGGSAGGLILGTYQPFTLDPNVPNPPRGTGYGTTPVEEGTAMKLFQFFGANTYIGTSPISFQSGRPKTAPSITVDEAGNLSADMSSWEVMWNGSVFEQGPRPSGSEFIPAVGTYDYDTGDYVVEWTSKIVGGPFSGVPGHWHLEGTILADPAIAEALAEPRTIHINDQGHGFRITISLTDPAGNDISADDINEGIMISSIGSVDIPEGEITENIAHRKTHGNTVRVLFDDPATGSLQDIIAAVSNVPHGSHVTICATGKARDVDGILRPFEGCSDIAVRTKNEN